MPPEFLPPSAQPPMGLHVEILQYRGFSNPWVRQRRPLLRVRLVGADGHRHLIGVWDGSELPHARERARWWQWFLGDVPIVHRTGPEQADGNVPPDALLTLAPVPAVAGGRLS